jgi:endoglucanase
MNNQMRLGVLTLAGCLAPIGLAQDQAVQNRAGPLALAAPAGREAAFAANTRLRHTINFGNMLEAPTEGAWGLKFEDRFVGLAKQAGFTAVRLPIRWNAHAQMQAPYTVDPAFFTRVDGILAQMRRAGLSVILDFHHYEELASDPAGHRARFLAIWKQVAEHYRAQPRDVLFEVLNEPSGKLNAVWNEYQAAAVAVIRQSNLKRVLIVGPSAWNSASQLAALKLPADADLIVTFHNYSPMEFTHQGTDFTGEKKPSGIAWPAVGLRPANGWDNWSWDMKLTGTQGGLNISQSKAYGALYVHRDQPLTGVRAISFVADRTAKLGVVCLERNDGKSGHQVASVEAQAGAVTLVPVAACGGTGTVRDVWIMPQGTEAQPPLTLSRFELLTDAGTRSVLGSAQDEAAAPIRTAAAWGHANGRPMFMGEFGAYRAGPNADRARWAQAQRTEAEQLNVSWAWWELASGFGLYDPLKNVWDGPVLRALLPTSSVAGR